MEAQIFLVTLALAGCGGRLEAVHECDLPALAANVPAVVAASNPQVQCLCTQGPVSCGMDPHDPIIAGCVQTCRERQ